MGMSDTFVVFVNDTLSLWIMLLLGITLLLTLCQYSRRFNFFEISIISSLSAISIVGRLVFFFIPFFKPSSALIIISASVFGPVVGLWVGMLTGFISSIVLGMGTWTPFQMICWGLIGFFAGFLNKRKFKACIFGFLMTTVFYGLIMNFYAMLTSGNVYSWHIFMLFELHGLPGDIIHGVSTVIFLVICWNPMRKRLLRLKIKYGVLTKEGMYSSNIFN